MTQEAEFGCFRLMKLFTSELLFNLRKAANFWIIHATQLGLHNREQDEEMFKVLWALTTQMFVGG